jgi:hypothetical protein
MKPSQSEECQEVKVDFHGFAPQVAFLRRGLGNHQDSIFSAVAFAI